MSEALKATLSDLQNDTISVLQHLSRMLMANNENGRVGAKRIDDYLCELENLCIKSRVILDKHRPQELTSGNQLIGGDSIDIAGSIEVTVEGWLHITLNTLLPNCRHRVSNYIGDTIGRLIQNCGYNLPYFEKAFLAIVEYCNHENHNALDSDNKGWKMIPNALKGSVIEDDSQFVLSIGLFSEISDDVRCEIYVMPYEDSSIFTAMLASGMV